MLSPALHSGCLQRPRIGVPGFIGPGEGGARRDRRAKWNRKETMRRKEEASALFLFTFLSVTL